ncbi:MAG: tetratricopeptide repeat protein [Steroidobacteraceae bacterium]|jgi:TPR repeat protein
MPALARTYNLSIQYLDGKGVPRDEARAFELNAEAAESGYHDAVLAMGWFYLNGVGVESNVELAEHWYRKSARQGETKAMFSLGQMAYRQRAFEDAYVWFTRASEKGHARSIYWLGKLHWHGNGVPSADRTHAMTFFQKAARANQVEAKRLLRYLSRIR